jgi:toxin ParE1/3/4
MRVVISDTAKAELTRQLAYIRDRNPEAAQRQRRLLSAAVDRLRSMPQMGRPGRVEATRELVISGTPFLFVYAIEGDQIAILHALHSRQQWPSDEE